MTVARRGATSVGVLMLIGSLGACGVQGVASEPACTALDAEPMVVRVVVHAVNRHHARVTARDIVAIANDRLSPAGIELHIEDTVVHADLPASYEAQPLSAWTRSDAVNVFIFLGVEGRTDEGPAEVQGRYLGDGTIVISGNTGGWDTLAHEIGHMLGLRHVADPRNVMGEDRFWHTSFTPDQGRAMRRRIRALQRRVVQHAPLPGASARR